MTNPGVAKRRLFSQQLLGGDATRPGDVLSWLGAVQAQEYAPAKWALGMRAQGVTDADVEGAFTRGELLRTHLLRPTWHFVTPADIRWMLALTAPRVHALNAHMYRRLAFDAATLRRSNAALAKALQGGQQLTRDELRDILRRSRIPVDGEMRMGYLMMAAELDGVVCSGARRGKQFTYALLDERAPSSRTMSRDDALVELAHRYFVSRGPATLHDFAKWSGLTMADGKRGVAGVGDRLSHETVQHRVFWFAPSTTASSRRSRSSAHLLPIYDEYVSSYKDRSAMISATNSERLKRMGNALNHIIVVDGQIVGTWRREIERDAVVVTLNVLEQLTAAHHRALLQEIRRFGEFVATPVRIIGLPRLD